MFKTIERIVKYRLTDHLLVIYQILVNLLIVNSISLKLTCIISFVHNYFVSSSLFSPYFQQPCRYFRLLCFQFPSHFSRPISILHHVGVSWRRPEAANPDSATAFHSVFILSSSSTGCCLAPRVDVVHTTCSSAS